jgi:hypothetical protein
MSLLDEITAVCTPEEIASAEHGMIAERVSVGRTRPSTTHIGEGKLLEVLGLAAGNAFLDVINTVPDYRHVKKIIARGDFDMSTSVSQDGVQAMVPAVLTQVQADALKALGLTSAPVSVQEVIEALKG